VIVEVSNPSEPGDAILHIKMRRSLNGCQREMDDQPDICISGPTLLKPAPDSWVTDDSLRQLTSA
jgi:hypothetical protein